MLGDSYKVSRTSGEDVVWIDGFPYLPKLHIHEHNILSVAQRVFGLLNERNVENLPSWTDNTIITRVEGGATNSLYRIGTSVLVRIFGAEGMIDRDAETAVYARLAQQGLAPAYYGRLANGRIEKWLPRSRTLTTPEMPLFAKTIAKQLRRLHDSTPALVGDATPQPPLQPTLWKELRTWLEQAEAHYSDASANGNLKDLVVRVRPELPWLQSLAHNFPCRVGFCHNDILAANILVEEQNNESKEESVVQLIDFEYGGINYFAFDIANHWNEYAGEFVIAATPITLTPPTPRLLGCPPTCTDPDYSLLPTVEVRKAFLESYATGASGGRPITPVQDSVVFEKEVDFFLLVNHLYWGLWAVNQSATEGNDGYNYARYATSRIGQYFIDKPKLEQQLVETCQKATAAPGC